MSQNSKTKVISNLLFLSIIFHALYIISEILVIICQIPITKMIYGASISPMFPAPLIILDLFRLLVHIVIVLIILRQLKNNNTNRVLEIVSIVFYGELFASTSIISKAIFEKFNSHQGIDFITRYIHLMQIINLAGVFYHIGSILLIIACAMSWWYKKYELSESKNILENNPMEDDEVK